MALAASVACCLAAFLVMAAPPGAAALHVAEMGDELGVAVAAGVRTWLRSESIMVYSEPKTGTGSLRHTVERMMDPPCHVGLETGNRSRRGVRCHSSECATSFLLAQPEGSRTWVLSSARDPFAHRPSQMFQNIYHKYTSEELARTPVDALVRDLHETLQRTPTRWWRQHFLGPLGINITDHDFDREKGLMHFSHTWQGRHLEVLVVRVEDAPRWKDTFLPFFPAWDPIMANKGIWHSYAQKYQEFLKTFSYTDEEIEVLSATEGFRHFYNESEVDAAVTRERARQSRPGSQLLQLYSSDDTQKSEVNDLASLEEASAALPEC